MYGYIRVASAVPKLSVGNCIYNALEIIETINLANSKGVKAITFPELCITGYTCGDLFFQSTLLEAAETALQSILSSTKNLDMLIFLGMPIIADNQIFNCAVALHNGDIKAIVPKIFLPNSNEFSEKRWFASGSDIISTEIKLCGQTVPIGSDIIFEFNNIKDLIIGVEICQDVWCTIPPSSYQALQGANIIFNLSASNELADKSNFRKSMIQEHSARLTMGYVYSSAGMYESTTDMVFGGHSIICENGKLLSEGETFLKESSFIYNDIDVNLLMLKRINDISSFTEQLRLNNPRKFRKISVNLKNDQEFELKRVISKTPFIPIKDYEYENKLKNILQIQLVGLARRILHVKSQKAIIAVSGGLDSTLALICTVGAFKFLDKDLKDIVAITMPGFGTTERTYNNAIQLIKSLGVTLRDINIKDACIQHFKDIGQDVNKHDITFENVQARERTQILMDIANMENGIVVGTGGLSELALGFSTYNGDHMSMYNVNCGIPKTLIREVLNYILLSEEYSQPIKFVISDILNTPVSPELLPPNKNGEINQKTEEVVGSYVINDFFLYHVLHNKFNPKKIIFMAQNAFKGDYSKEELIERLKLFYKRFFTQQFKRSCMPDGPKIIEVSLSPRGDFKMPSDASYNLWLNELDNM